MKREEVEAAYKAQGLTTEYGYDVPGKVYEPHRHERTVLFTLAGSIRVKIENEVWKELHPGSEFVIGNEALHEGIVGNEGWEYIAAWNPEEEAKFGKPNDI
mgnify:FL=1